MSYDNHWTSCRCERCLEKWRRFQKAFGEETLPWPDDPEALARGIEEHARLICIYERYCRSEYEEIFSLTRETATKQNPDFLVLGNFNAGYNTFTLPTNNAVSTEDGNEPGYIQGTLVHNMGLLRAWARPGSFP